MRGNHVKKGRVGNTNQMEHTEYSLPGLEQRIDHLHIINLLFVRRRVCKPTSYEAELLSHM